MAEGTSNARKRGTRSRVVHLPAQLGIASVAELKTVLTDALAGGRPVTLDARAVEQIDGAGLQLLVVFHSAMQTAGQPLTWRRLPSALSEAAALFGVRKTLGLDG